MLPADHSALRSRGRSTWSGSLTVGSRISSSTPTGGAGHAADHPRQRDTVTTINGPVGGEPA